VSIRDAAELQVLLEGVPLPAGKRELLDYARAQDAGGRLIGLLDRLPDRRYGSLDEVGEALEPVQPPRDARRMDEPRAESGIPPGGEAYTDARAEPGWVRERGPR
jgi:Protein of unknown function (DUF2795)